MPKAPAPRPILLRGANAPRELIEGCPPSEPFEECSPCDASGPQRQSVRSRQMIAATSHLVCGAGGIERFAPFHRRIRTPTSPAARSAAQGIHCAHSLSETSAYVRQGYVAATDQGSLTGLPSPPCSLRNLRNLCGPGKVRQSGETQY